MTIPTLPQDPQARKDHMKRRVDLTMKLFAAVSGKAVLDMEALELLGDFADEELAPLERFAAELLRRRCDHLPISYVAKLLRYKKREIRTMCEHGELPATLHDGKWRIKSRDLERFMDAWTVCATAPATDD